MSKKDLELFLRNTQEEKNLLEKIKGAATGNEISEIRSTFKYHFSGEELKSISNKMSLG